MQARACPRDISSADNLSSQLITQTSLDRLSSCMRLRDYQSKRNIMKDVSLSRRALRHFPRPDCGFKSKFKSAHETWDDPSVNGHSRTGCFGVHRHFTLC